MITSSSALPDFASLAEVIPLPEAASDWAIHHCQTIADSNEQWQRYLRSLAVIGVKHWLEAGITPYDIQFDEQQLPDPATTLHVNGFRVGVVPIGSLPPETVFMPQSTVEGTQTMHLWLLVEVQEELSQVRVVQALEGCHVATQATACTAAGDYQLPLTAFTLPPDRALWYLSHLVPALVSVPVSQSTASPAIASLSRRVMNVGRWLQDQLDDVAQQFAWTLLDPLTPAMALRSPTQALETILTSMEPQGVAIPARARAAYTEVQVANTPLHVYALIWTVFESTIPEWSLLILVGPAPDESLPPGLTLRISDAEAVLTEQTFAAESEATYLYTQVFGTWDESFTLEIIPPDGDQPMTLPAFGFQPNP